MEKSPRAISVSFECDRRANLAIWWKSILPSWELAWHSRSTDRRLWKQFFGNFCFFVALWNFNGRRNFRSCFFLWAPRLSFLLQLHHRKKKFRILFLCLFFVLFSHASRLTFTTWKTKDCIRKRIKDVPFTSAFCSISMLNAFPSSHLNLPIQWVVKKVFLSATPSAITVNTRWYLTRIVFKTWFFY